MRHILVAFTMLFSVVSSAFASDAKTYVLMPSDTDITEFRVAYSEVDSFGSPMMTSNLSKSIKHSHYFDLNGNLAAVYLTLPYADLEQKNNSITMGKQSGFGDPVLLFAMGVYNTPALSRKEFAKREKNGVTAACSVSINLPRGSYDNTRTLNVGGNRYTAKPECQIGYAYNRTLVEFIGGFTHYWDNDQYAGNNTMSQDNLYHIETHVSYSLTPKLWASADTFYVNGGNVQINGRDMHKSQSSFSLGSVVGYVIDQKQLVKLIYQKSVRASSTSQRLEGVAFSYNYMW